MPDDLRSKMIRLAHSRPDLRPHLLPLLAADTQKKAWSRIPTDYFDFGYVGPGAEAVGLEMALAVQAAVQKAKTQAFSSWDMLAKDLIGNRKVDKQPGLSRRVVALAFKDTYAELTKKAEAYFDALP